MIVYDLEIVKVIPPRDGQRKLGLEYCEGWHDHKGMGISVLCAHDVETGRSRVFMADNLDQFLPWVEGKRLVGFNNLNFDNRVLRANGVMVDDEQCRDLLVAVWAAHGLGPIFDHKTHGGFGLDALARANLDAQKSGSGELAPELWQQGAIGQVVDYCLNDVFLTARLILKWRHNGGRLQSPKTGKTVDVAIAVNRDVCADRVHTDR